MANRTDPRALRAHGSDPQLLIEKITREKIYESRFWKEHLFALTVEDLVEKITVNTLNSSNANEVSNKQLVPYIGGVYGPFKLPSPFLCLVLKMLQLGPDKDIVFYLIEQEDFKYLRVLAAFYLRLTGNAVEVYSKLEPLYQDYRKVILRTGTAIGGKSDFTISTVDQFVERLLHEQDVCDIKLPRLTARHVLVETKQLRKRISPIQDEINDLLLAQEKDKSVEVNEIKILDKAVDASIPMKNEKYEPREDRSKNKDKISGMASPLKRRRSKDTDKQEHKSRHKSDSHGHSSDHLGDQRTISPLRYRSRRDQEWSPSYHRNHRNQRDNRDHCSRHHHRRSRSGSPSNHYSYRHRSSRRGEGRESQQSPRRSSPPQPGSSHRDRSRERYREHEHRRSNKKRKTAEEYNDESSPKQNSDPTVDEWNEIRAKLGLKPLK